MNDKIAYICDRHECEICDNPECRHTFNIEHAVNFKKFDPDHYIEEPRETRLSINGYQNKAMRTAKEECRELSNVGLGLAGEAGEVVDMIKKHLYHGHPLDREAFIKELGDLAWYLALACTVIGEPMEKVLQANIDKLLKRYPEGFSSHRSIHREEEGM